MNLQNEENNLPLFKYNPEATSQLLIQTNEQQEFVQVPNICDDLMLTGIEEGTVTWALGGLPVLLNGLNEQQHLLNQLSTNETTEELQSQQDIVISDLLNQCNNDSQINNSTTDENTEIVYPLELPEKEFLTDNGLFTPHSDVINNQSLSSDDKLANNDHDDQSMRQDGDQMSSGALVDEIQSSDVSSQGSFIDINGLLIPQQSALNLNNQDLLFSLQDTNQITQHNKGNIIFDNIINQKKVKKVKMKTRNNVSLLRNIAYIEQNADFVQNTNQDENESDKVQNPMFDSASLIRVLTEDGTHAVLNVDSSFFENKPEEDHEEMQPVELAVDEEPDSTVTNDDTDENLNIDELATVITAYRCKKCDFTCNDRDQFFAHFKEIHMKPSVQKPVEQIYRVNQNFVIANQEPSSRKRSENRRLDRKTKLNNDNIPTFKIFCTNGEITNILAASSQDMLESNIVGSENTMENVETETTNTQVQTESKPDNNEIHVPAVDEEQGARIYVTEDGLLQIPISEDGVELTISEQDLQQLLGANSETSSSTIISPQTISLIYKNNEITGIAMLAAEREDTEKKIMRVKRKKKKRLPKGIIRLSENHQTISFVSDLIMDDLPAVETSAANMASTESEGIDKEVQFETETSNFAAADGAKEKQLIYLCAQCAEQFLTVEDCREHMIKDHKLCAVESSDTVEKENDGKSSDPLHLAATNMDGNNVREKNKKIIEKFLTQDVLKPRKIKCTRRGCPYRFARPELLARHMACHVDGVRAQFRCPECGELHNSWRLCSVHLWRCHQLDVDMFACPLCTYKASTYVKLKYHMKIHGDERDYVCPECGRGFKQASQLRNHRVIHLDRQLQEVPKWYVQKHCDKCGKLFADSKCLKKHVQAVHSKLKPFICNVCGHSCARKAMLQMHLRQHTGEKPYACKLCLYKTGDHNSLRRHVMRHSGTRPYKCPHCSYTAIQSNSYKNHLASKHPGMSGSYSCTECPFKTVNEESFTSHMNDHQSEVTKGNCSVSMIYDPLHTSNAENSSNNDTPIYTVPSATGSVIIIPRDKKSMDVEDDETQNCFLSLSDLTDEQTVDTGGITIPA